MRYKCFDDKKGIDVAEWLLEAGAIKLRPENPFQWASGWKSPIYCDNRISLSYPEIRTKIKVLLSEAIKLYFPEVEAIAGVATAGIPQGALVAEALNLPFIYVRSSSKGHGLTNQIEGKIVENQKVVVLEDLVSTGGSSLAAVTALKTSGIQVLGMCCIFTYGFPQAEKNFISQSVDLVYLSEYKLLLEKAVSKGIVDSSLIQMLNDWRANPENWG